MKIVIVWLLVFNFFSCSHNNQQPSMPVVVIPKNVKEVKVTLRIYSGRENPSWNLSEKQIADLITLFGDLPKSDPFTLPDNLGYQGFQIKFSEETAEKTQEVVVYKGRILFKSAEADKYFTDTNRRLEIFLLNSADFLSDDPYKSVKEEITAEKK